MKPEDIKVGNVYTIPYKPYTRTLEAVEAFDSDLIPEPIAVSASSSDDDYENTFGNYGFTFGTYGTASKTKSKPQIQKRREEFGILLSPGYSVTLTVKDIFSLASVVVYVVTKKPDKYGTGYTSNGFLALVTKENLIKSLV
jgi:hypothetical protein